MHYLHDLLKATCVLHYKEVDLGLDRCLALLEKLGNPHLRIPPVFHVTGTNGKGSTLAFVKQILQDNGYSVHRYTSPHLVSFNERIELCGLPATDDVLADALAEVLRVNDGAPITTFEATTCLAFVLFAQIPADFTLLEVGVGGRLDATNVIQHPLVTAITSISLDHQSDLGETIEAIAFEKAGVIKPGIPVVVPLTIGTAYGIIAKIALEKKSPLVSISKLTVSNDLGLHGDHQRMNAAVAVQMIKSAGIECINVSASLKKVQWPGRLQALSLPQGELWVDGAHNEAGAKALATSLMQLNSGPWVFFIHIKARKDAAAMLAYFAPLASIFYFVDFPIEGGEGAFLLELQERAADLGVTSEVIPSLDHMFDIMITKNSPMIAAGSLFWVGHILEHLLSAGDTNTNPKRI